MDVEWETFKSRAAESMEQAKGANTSTGGLQARKSPGAMGTHLTPSSALTNSTPLLPPPPPPLVVKDGVKRPRTPVLAALKNSRVSRSLDTLPAEDIKNAAAAVAAKSASQQRPASSPDTSPEVSRRVRKGRKDSKNKQPVSPRSSYEMFKRFGRKREKVQEGLQRTTLTPQDQGRGWSRGSADKRGGADQLGVNAPNQFLIPPDMVERLIANIPADVYFKSLVESASTPASDAGAPFQSYMEGPDETESEITLYYSTSSDTSSQNSDSSTDYDDSLNGSVRACGRSVSTYPRVLVMPGTRLGDPVCDCFALRFYRNGAIFCLCDGCGWGRAAVDAARSVRAVFMQSLHQHSLIVKQSSRRELMPTNETTEERGDKLLSAEENFRTRSRSDGGLVKGKVMRGAHRVMEMMGVSSSYNEDSKRSIRQAAECLLHLVGKAHTNISAGKEVWECGTTTVCAGILVDLDVPSTSSPVSEPKTKHGQLRYSSDADRMRGRRKGLLVVSIGDCKVYLYSHAKGTIKDLTQGNRQNATSVNDCGGRLGPASGPESTEPDLRNLDIYFSECDEGDCVWAVSDGVHDNFDPQMLGLMPHDIDDQVATTVEWEALPPDTALRLKNEFAVRALERELLPSPSFPSPRLMLSSQSPRSQQQRQPRSPRGTENGGQHNNQLRPSSGMTAHLSEEPSATQIFYNAISRGSKQLIDNKDGTPLVILSDHDQHAVEEAQQHATTGSDTCAAVPTDDGPQQEPSSPDSSSLAPVELSRIARAGTDKRSSGGCRGGLRLTAALNPAEVTRKLVDLCVEQTLLTRTFMEQNPEKRQPCDYRSFPGKLDHTTCLAFRA